MQNVVQTRVFSNGLERSDNKLTQKDDANVRAASPRQQQHNTNGSDRRLQAVWRVAQEYEDSDNNIDWAHGRPSSGETGKQ